MHPSGASDADIVSFSFLCFTSKILYVLFFSKCLVIMICSKLNIKNYSWGTEVPEKKF